MLKRLTVIMTLILMFEVSAEERPPVGLRRRCPAPPEPTTVRSMDELMPILRSNRIEILEGSPITPLNVEKFLVEYNKMPGHFRNELLSNKARIRIMEGTGVGMDPSLKDKVTVEGTRLWINVPGGGGQPRANVPMRIAINHLHDHSHGASNLFLHEHAHTLDSLYGTHSLSSSPVFQNLIHNAPRSREFLQRLCSNEYCTPDKPVEAFAELFSYYHACERTRSHMEQAVPEIAEFFSKFNSGIDLKNGNVANWALLPAPAAGSEIAASPSANTEDCDTSPTADFSRSIDDFKKISNELSRTLPVKPTLRSGSTGVSASGLK